MLERPVRMTDHAVWQAQRRAIDLEIALSVVNTPGQIVPVREFRQSITDDGRLLRVLVDLTDQEPVVVTMYRTSKLEKYWKR